MDLLKIGIYILCGLVTALLICVIGQMVYIGNDAINTRPLECKNITVENTSYIATSSFFITINDIPRMVLDTADSNVIRKWGKIEPGDIVSAKLGKATVEFC